MEKVLTLEEVTHRHIISTLDQFSWNRTEAARALGIAVRTIRNKIQEIKAKNPSIVIKDNNNVPGRKFNYDEIYGLFKQHRFNPRLICINTGMTSTKVAQRMVALRDLGYRLPDFSSDRSIEGRRMAIKRFFDEK